MPSLIIGNLNQAPAQRGNTWKPGDIFSALEYHTMFFNSAEGLEAVDPDPEIRRLFRSWGSFVIKVQDVFGARGNARIAALDFVDISTHKPYDAILHSQGIETSNYDMVMTLPSGSAVEDGMLFNVGYLSILEPLGDAKYRLLHDYPISRSGPRFELFDDDPDQYVLSRAEEMAGSP